MPKKQSAAEMAAGVQWVARLPESGGVWGRGITEVVDSTASEVAGLERQIAQLRATANARRKLLADTVKRAEKEAHLMFTEGQIAKAKSGS